MERLTSKQTKEKIKAINKPNVEMTKKQFLDIYEKLLEFEDFMEKYNVESMEDLELRLEDIEHYAYNCNVEQIDEIIKFKQENQALKDRWYKLKEWAGYLCYFELVDKMEELEKE